MELDIDDVPWKDDLVTEPPEIINGYMTIPRTPSWGTDLNEDESQAEQELWSFMESYYGAPCETLARTQSMCAGSGKRCITWLKDFVAAGAQTIVIRFGSADQSAQLERCANDILPGVRA